MGTWVQLEFYSYNQRLIGATTLQASTSGGQATIYPTDDKTVNGNALFSEILDVFVMGVNDTTNPVDFPLGSIKQKDVNGDQKTVTLNIGKGKNLLALGLTLEDAPDGTTVSVLVFGIPI